MLWTPWKGDGGLNGQVWRLSMGHVHLILNRDNKPLLDEPGSVEHVAKASNNEGLA